MIMKKIKSIAIVLSLLTIIFIGIHRDEESSHNESEITHYGKSDALLWDYDNNKGRATITVDDDGDAHFDNIQDAVDAANYGDTIEVNAGTYVQSISIYKSLKIVAIDGPAVTIIDPPNGNNRSCFFIRANNVTIDGFNMTGTNGRGSYGIDFQGSYNTFSNNVIHNLNGLETGAGICSWDRNGGSDNNVISYNTIYDISEADGILIGASTMKGVNEGNVIKNNIISNSGSWHPGIEVVNGRKFNVSKNYVSGHGTGPQYYGILLLSWNTLLQGGHLVAGNVVRGFEAGIMIMGDTGENGYGGVIHGYGEADKITISENEINNNVVYGNTISGIELWGVFEEEVVNIYDNTISDNEIHENIGNGIRLNLNTNNTTVIHNNIHDNQYAGIINRGASNKAHYNNFSNNEVFGIKNTYETIFNATNNYWGDVTGPYNKVSNSDGLGDAVNDNVNFYPWWEATYESFAPESSIRPGLPAYKNNVSLNTSITISSTDEESGVACIYWLLDNGDLNVVYGDNASFNFSDGGETTIEYWAVDNSGTEEQPHNYHTYFVDDVLPFADAGFNLTVAQGTNVILNGTASFDNLGIDNFTWTFFYNGVDQVLFGHIVNFNFNVAGNYSIILTVRDHLGLSSNDTIWIEVSDITPPVADAGFAISVDQSDTVYFNGDGSTDNVGIVNYTWTFNDGGEQKLYGVRPNYTFYNAGVFSVLLNITDRVGYWHTDNVTVTVNDTTPPITSAGPDRSVSQGDVVLFNGTGSRDNVGIINYSWDFSYNGEAWSFYGKTSNFTFEIPGLYFISLTTTDKAGNSGKDTFSVRVIEIPATEVIRLILGPFRWSDGTPMVDMTVTLDSGTRTVYSEKTNEDGVAKFTEPIEFGNYTYKIAKLKKGKTVKIQIGDLTINPNTPNDRPWFPEKQHEETTYGYTEDEFDEMAGFKESVGSKPARIFLPNVEVEVSISDTDRKVKVKVLKAGNFTVKADIGLKKDLTLRKGEPKEVDSDADGEVDLKVTYNGNDAFGNPIIIFDTISASEEPSVRSTILIVIFIFIVLISVFIVFRSRRRKSSFEEPPGKMEIDKEIDDKKEEPTEEPVEITSVALDLESLQLKETVIEKLSDVLEDGIKTVRETIDDAKRMHVNIEEEEEFISLVENLQEKGKYLEAIGTLKGVETLLEEKKKEWGDAPHIARIREAEKRLLVFGEDNRPQATKLRIRLMSAKLALEEDNYMEVNRQIEIINAGLEVMEAAEKEVDIIKEEVDGREGEEVVIIEKEGEKRRGKEELEIEEATEGGVEAEDDVVEVEYDVEDDVVEEEEGVEVEDDVVEEEEGVEVEDDVVEDRSDRDGITEELDSEEREKQEEFENIVLDKEGRYVEPEKGYDFELILSPYTFQDHKIEGNSQSEELKNEDEENEGDIVFNDGSDNEFGALKHPYFTKGDLDMMEFIQWAENYMEGKSNEGEKD